VEVISERRRKREIRVRKWRPVLSTSPLPYPKLLNRKYCDYHHFTDGKMEGRLREVKWFGQSHTYLVNGKARMVSMSRRAELCQQQEARLSDGQVSGVLVGWHNKMPGWVT
jgi:hypothetical protein